MKMEANNSITCRRVKKKHQKPKGVDIGLKISEQITPKMNGLQAAIDANPRDPYETTLVRHALKKTGYGTNGRFGYVNIDAEKRVVDQFGYRLTRSRTAEKRIFFLQDFVHEKCAPLKSEFRRLCLLASFPDAAYNEDGILHELARLLGAISDIESARIDTSFVFDHKRDVYYRFAILSHYFPHLSRQFGVIYEFAKVHKAFINSDYYKGDDNYAAYCYFKTGINSQSSIRDKVLNVRYCGMRTCGIGGRLSTVRGRMAETTELLVACDSLNFEGVELDTNVSKQTACELEQLAISCFLNAPTDHPLNRLKNKIFVTGNAHKIFNNITHEKLLAAYVLVSGLAVDKQVTAKRSRKNKDLTIGSNWFHVDLTPKETSGKNAAIDQIKLNVIEYYAGLLRAGDDWESQTLDAQLAETNAENEALNIQLDECKAENEELHSFLPDYMH